MKRGGELEKLVQLWLDKTAAHHTVARLEPPVKVFRMIGKGAQFLGCFTAPGCLDYGGGCGCRHVEFDAKDTKTTLKFDGKMVSQNCLYRMERLHANGDRAGILVRFRSANANDDEVWLVGSEWIFGTLLTAKKSASRADLANAARVGHDVWRVRHPYVAAKAGADLVLWMSKTA